MKKRVFLVSLPVILLLATLPIASAQTIQLFGTELSLVTAVPIILIALMLLGFMVIFIKDKLQEKLARSKKQKEPKQEIKQIEELPEPVRKELKEPISIKPIMVDLRKKLAELSNNIPNLQPKESLKQVREIAKLYFKQRYN